MIPPHLPRVGCPLPNLVYLVFFLGAHQKNTSGLTDGLNQCWRRWDMGYDIAINLVSLSYTREALNSQRVYE